MSNNIMVRIYDKYDDAYADVKNLMDRGVLKKYISVIGRAEEEKAGEYEEEKSLDKLVFWGEQGAFWGGLWGLLAGGTLLAVPGFGPLAATGQIMSAVAGMLGGAAIFGTTGAMTAWFADRGVEDSLAQKYSKYLEDGKIMLIVHESTDAVEMAEKILNESSK
ncbi:hypothetical protein [Sulfurimonas sp.]